MRYPLLFLVLWLVMPFAGYAQYSYQPVFPELAGETLANEVRNAFRPDVVIPYTTARDTLFLKIDAVNRNLSCIYTGLTLYIPEGQDPTQAVFLNGAADGINTEHTYPQGFGLADTKAESDMHNLFPSRVKTNNDRANRPFGESPDPSTTRWYLLNTELTSIPGSMVDKYSELGSAGQFEPREEVKGDIARAMMYVYTIYRDQVVAADANYFPLQKDLLCQWHNQDPVDEKEWNRTLKIASYQSGKANPFVLDCSLANRMYCQNTSAAMSCRLLATTESQQDHMYFNASSQSLELPEGTVALWIYDTMGKLIYQENNGNACAEKRWQAVSYPGLLIARAASSNGQWTSLQFVPLR